MPQRLRPVARPIKLPIKLGRFTSSVILAAAVGWLSHYGLSRPWFVVVAVGLVIIAEGQPVYQNWRTAWLAVLPDVVLGTAVAVTIALSPRALTQFGIAAGYAAWRGWRRSRSAEPSSLSEGLALQALVFVAIFLAAAIWRVPTWICLIIAWGTSYILIYQTLLSRGDRLARILAATWSLIVVEVGWVLSNWLVTYVLFGSYVLVPQAALILTGLAYCFGGIYVSQRQQALTRGRLAEYLLIALLLVIIVVSSTPWRGTL